MFVWFWKLQVDVVISEPALDTCLFLIGALEFAGPYTLRQSPVLANRCLVIHLFWFCGWWVSSGGGGTNGIGQIMLKEMFFGQEKMVLICWLESAGWQSYGGWTSLLFWSWKCKTRWLNWVLGVRCFSYKVYTKYTPACLPACLLNSLFTFLVIFGILKWGQQKHRNFVVQKSFVQLFIVSSGQAHKITKGLDISSGGIISENLLTKRRNYIISCGSVTSWSWCTSYSYSLGIGWRYCHPFFLLFAIHLFSLSLQVQNYPINSLYDI